MRQTLVDDYRCVPGVPHLAKNRQGVSGPFDVDGNKLAHLDSVRLSP